MSDDELRYESRMSDADALMWTIEKDPLLRSTITAVSLLDRSPDPARLAEGIDRATRIIPRLRQRVVSNPFSLAPPRWELDPRFDQRYHVRHVAAAGDGSLRAVLDVAQWAGMQGFDRARPLWEFYVVDGLDDGRAALIQKVHHSITDGIGSIKMALALFDLEPDPADQGPAPEVPDIAPLGPLERVVDGLAHVQRRQLGIAKRAPGTLARGLQHLVGDPVGSAREVAHTVGSVARLLAPVTHPMSPVMTDRSLAVRYETITRPLDEMRRAAKAAEVRINDVFLAAVGGAFRTYHEALGVPVDSARVTMPINIRSGESEALAGNKFVPARFVIPVDVADPVERMTTIRRIVEAERVEPSLNFVEPVAGVLNRLPATLTTAVFGSMLKGVDVVASNVPGAPIPLYVAGSQIVEQFAFGPPSGAAANITLLSWGPEACIGVNLDQAAVTDTDRFMACLDDALTEVIDAA